jgi:hypothetical protein
MNMTKHSKNVGHTKGPWDVRRLYREPGLQRIAITGTQEFEESANARLIAAAPDLLEVAKLVLSMAEAMKLEQDAMPRSYQAPKSVDAIGVAIERARAALAKADGSNQP